MTRFVGLFEIGLFKTNMPVSQDKNVIILTLLLYIISVYPFLRNCLIFEMCGKFDELIQGTINLDKAVSCIPPVVPCLPHTACRHAGAECIPSFGFLFHHHTFLYMSSKNSMVSTSHQLQNMI